MAVEAMTGRAGRRELRALTKVRRQTKLRNGNGQTRGHRKQNDSMQAERIVAGGPQSTGQRSNPSASIDHEMMRQCVGLAPILRPNELQPAALSRAQVELKIGIGRDSLV